jgi:toxin ParE1/3/4
VKRKVRWYGQAIDDLLAQTDYIAADSPKAARVVALRLRRAGADLGRMATGRPGRTDGTYEKVVAGLPYLLVYAIGPASSGGEIVSVLRIIHQAQQWPPVKDDD